MAIAEEFDIPVGIHTGLAPPGTPYGCCPDFRIELGNPLVLEPMLKRHPNLRVWLMHAGWPFLEETKALLYMYPQVHADVSVIDWIIPREEFHAYLEALVRAGLADRLMFDTVVAVPLEKTGLANRKGDVRLLVTLTSRILP